MQNAQPAITTVGWVDWSKWGLFGKIGWGNNSVVVITNHYSHLTLREKNRKNILQIFSSTQGAPLFVGAPLHLEGRAPLGLICKSCSTKINFALWPEFSFSELVVKFSPSLPRNNSTFWSCFCHIKLPQSKLYKKNQFMSRTNFLKLLHPTHPLKNPRTLWFNIFPRRPKGSFSGSRISHE